MDKEFLEELEDRKFNLCQRIVDTPSFMILGLIRLKAELKQLKSIIRLANQYK